jgi:hypothetical protein
MTARNALVSIGVQFDANDKAIPAKPENVLMGAVPTQVPQEAPAPAAPKPAAPVRAFRTLQEAEAANLPKGTKITIGGRSAEVQ